jgi:hypothetical protein
LFSDLLVFNHASHSTEGLSPPTVFIHAGHTPCAAGNPAIALWLQSTPPAGRVAELGSLGRAHAMQYQQSKAPFFIGCIVLLATVVSLIVGFLILIGVIKPQSWGPPPWGAEAREARQLLSQFGATASVTNRIQAVHRILAIRSPDAIAHMQTKALADSSSEVRAATVLGLLDCLNQNPGLLVKRNIVGMRVGYYVNRDMIQRMGQSDGSAEVRIAVARFWAEARDFSPEAEKNLQRMLAATADQKVQDAVRTNLAKLKAR